VFRSVDGYRLKGPASSFADDYRRFAFCIAVLFKYYKAMKKIMVSLPDDVWLMVKEKASERGISPSRFIRERLTETAGVRIARLAREIGPALEPMKFNREKMYEDVI